MTGKADDSVRIVLVNLETRLPSGEGSINIPGPFPAAHHTPTTMELPGHSNLLLSTRPDVSTVAELGVI